MSGDLVKRLRGGYVVDYDEENQVALCKEAADRIEELERAVLDLAQYVSHADLCFYLEPKTRSILNAICEKTK